MIIPLVLIKVIGADITGPVLDPAATQGESCSESGLSLGLSAACSESGLSLGLSAACQCCRCTAQLSAQGQEEGVYSHQM